MLSQVLHARGSAAPMMWAPVANNFISIAVGAVFLGFGTVDTGPGPGAARSLTPGEIAFVGGGATLGVIAQALVLLPALHRAGIRYRPRLDLGGSGLGRSARLAGWTLLFVAANQIAFLLTAVVANTAGKAAQGTVEWAAGLPTYTNAYMIMLVPHGLVTVSIAATLLPSMSRAAAEGRPADVGAEVSRALLLAGRVLVPLAGALAAVGPPLTRVMFFGNPEPDTWFMGVVLVAFAPAVLVFSAQFLMVRGLQAMEDTRTPAFIQILITAVQVLTAVLSGALLPQGWVLVGVAAGFSITYGVGLVAGVHALRRATGGSRGWQAVRPLARPAAATAPAAAAAAVMTQVLPDWWPGQPLGAAAGLLLAVLAFTIVYAGCVRLPDHRPSSR